MVLGHPTLFYLSEKHKNSPFSARNRSVGEACGCCARNNDCTLHPDTLVTLRLMVAVSNFYSLKRPAPSEEEYESNHATSGRDGNRLSLYCYFFSYNTVCNRLGTNE